LLFGSPPLYALSAVGGLQPDRWATGGGTSLRGVPIQRYHAKIKLLANFELRAGLGRFRLFGRPSRLSLLGFVDLGRFFADWVPQPALDGRGPGVKVGVGAGLRLRFGSSLVVRVDVGASADGWGSYLDIGHLF
jgi:hemolysin activation/secretion protein